MCLKWRPFQEHGEIFSISKKGESQQLLLMLCDDRGTKQGQKQKK